MQKNAFSKKTISVSIDTHDKLTELGGYNETMDSIIRKCIESHEKIISKEVS